MSVETIMLSNLYSPRVQVEPPLTLFEQVRPPQTSKSQQATVFIDRDGVINYNRSEHVLSWQDFRFEESALEGLRQLHQAGYRVIVVTNQAAIERGLISAAEVEELHRRMVEEVAQYGGSIEAVLYCPHRPEANCTCRKPRPGMLYQAAEQYKVELSQSWLIGDYLTDIQAGLAVGCKPVLVLTGRGQMALDSWQQGYPLADATTPITVKRHLLDAVEHILASEKVLV
jgi:D-glycero-D-manno-heptose 1,7-bisphosphate phosphatase